MLGNQRDASAAIARRSHCPNWLHAEILTSQCSPVLPGLGAVEFEWLVKMSPTAEEEGKKK